MKKYVHKFNTLKKNVFKYKYNMINELALILFLLVHSGKLSFFSFFMFLSHKVVQNLTYRKTEFYLKILSLSITNIQLN